MPQPTISFKRAAGLLATITGFVLLAITSACGNKLGDGCSSSIDCSLEGDRSCDVSQPGGYCTVQGCDIRSCPDEAMCVRFFPSKFLTTPCNPATEDISTDECSLDQLCTEGGLCAPRTTERRYCVVKCGGDGDCRGGYECRFVGEHGSSSLDPKDLGRARFCAPRAS